MKFPILCCSLVPTDSHMHVALIEPDFSICMAERTLPLEDCPNDLICVLEGWRDSLRVDDLFVLACPDDPWSEAILDDLGRAGFQPEFHSSAPQLFAVQERARQASVSQERARLLAFLAARACARESDNEAAHQWALRCAPTCLNLEQDRAWLYRQGGRTWNNA